MIVLPDRTTSEEVMVTHFWNSEARYQVVTDGPDATCPTCGYPERHRVYEDRNETLTLLADGCPSCETSRMPDREVCPQPCEHLSQHDAREGRTCPEHPCTCTDRENGSES